VSGNNVTLLHSHLRRNLTGEDDEVAVARLLIQASIDTPTTLHQSVLTMTNNNDNSPVHSLFGNFGSNSLDQTSYVELFMKMSDRVDRKHGTTRYWNQLMSQPNTHGLTPLHYLADHSSHAIGADLVLRIIKKADEASRLGILIHPLLISDNEEEVPLHYACCDATMDQDRFKAFVGMPDSTYEASYDAVFCLDVNGDIPVINLLRSFLEDEEEADDEGRNRLEQFFSDNGWWSSEDRVEISFQYLLASKQAMDMINFPTIREGYHQIWPKVKVLLEVAVKSNIHHIKPKDSYDISEEPLHLAASVENFPAFVLQLALLDDPLALLRRDSIGRIPLHYAIVAQPGIQGHRGNNEERTVYWMSRYELRSMVQYLLQQAPGSANIEDRDGRLPLHLAIVHGSDLKSVVDPILVAAPQDIAASDPLTNLKPFMLAASNDYTTLDVVYRLLVIDPSLLETTLR